MTVSITATPEPGNAPPRVRVDFTTDQSSVTLYRVAQDGTRTLVRTYDGGPLLVTAGSGFLYDHEAPFGQPVHYTADGAGVTNSAVVTLDADAVWLVHPGIPVLSQPIEPVSMEARELAAASSARYPLGRRFPIVATDGRRKAPQYELTVATETLGDRQALEDVLSDLSPLLLNVPASWGWGVVSEYVSVGGVREARAPGAWGGLPLRSWVLPCTVVARPPGGSRADVTYAVSQAAYATYADRYAAHATYREAIDP